jgi:hypothetical protein
MRKKIIILIVFIVVASVTGWYFFVRDASNVSDDPSLPYIPSIGEATYFIDGKEVNLRAYFPFGKDLPLPQCVYPTIRNAFALTYDSEILGDIDGDGDDKDALVIFADASTEERVNLYAVAENPALFYAAVVLYDDNVPNEFGSMGKYRATNSVFLGDRIIPQSYYLEDNLVKIEYLTRAPGEGFSIEPSVLETIELQFHGENLIQIKTD